MKKKLAPICFAAATACVIALAGCGNSDGLTGGVAATVNGTDIAEDKVTEAVMDVRTSQGVTSDEDWANFLNSYGLTPETIRENYLDSFVTQELEKQAAADAGIEVTDEEVDEGVAKTRENYDSDEAFASALESAGFTEDSYRETVYQSLLETKLFDSEIDEKDLKADDETVLSYVQMYGAMLDGAKRSSHILLASDDEETAQKVLDEINAGGDFAELAKEHSTDSGSAVNGGDVGWDRLNSFVTAYTDALDKLGKGETSGLVTSEFGIHIIRCTDVFDAPDEIKKLSDVPEDIVNYIRTNIADPQAASSAKSEYLESLKDKADIHTNDMPSDVPYNVDMGKYISSSASDSDADDEDADSDDVDVEVEDGDEADDEELVVDLDSDDVEVVEDDGEGDEAAEAEESESAN